MTDTAFNQAHALFDQALQALQPGQPQAAENHLLACLQLMPGRASPWVALGAARLRLHRASDALLALDEALLQDPTRNDAWGHRADALLRLARPAEALQALDSADPAEAATAWHRAQALHALGRHAQALLLLDELLARADSHAPNWLERVRTLQCLGRHVEAGPAYQRALQADPALGPACSLFGQWLKDQGQMAERSRANGGSTSRL